MTEIKPVAWAYEFHDFGTVWGRHVILNRPDGGANPPTKHHGSEIRNVRPLYGPEAMAEVERLRAANRLLEKQRNDADTYGDEQYAIAERLRSELKEALGEEG